METFTQAVNAPTTMMALRQRPGSTSFTYEPVTRPSAGIDEVLVRVHASGISLERRGPSELAASTSNPGPRIRSAEFAGTVASFGGGDGRGRFVVGEEVFGLIDATTCDAASDYVVVPATSLAARPKSISFAESAALPMASVLAWEAVASLGGFRPGQTILIDTACDWVVYAVQLAALLGAEVLAIAPESSAPLLRSLGAADVLLPDESRPVCDFTLTGSGAVLPQVTEPQLSVIAGLVDLGGLRPIVSYTLPIGAAADLLEHARANNAPGRAVLLIS